MLPGHPLQGSLTGTLTDVLTLMESQLGSQARVGRGCRVWEAPSWGGIQQEGPWPSMGKVEMMGALPGAALASLAQEGPPTTNTNNNKMNN